MSDDVKNIYKEARRAGVELALWFMFAMFLVNSLLFGFFIYKSFQTEIQTIEATQTNESGSNEIIQGGK